MDRVTYELIKSKITKANDSYNRAKGALDRVNSQLEKEFDASSLEQAQEISDSLEKQIDKASEKRDTLLEKLNEITDWDAL